MKSHLRPTAVLLFAAFSLSFPSNSARGGQPDKKPNILLIVADDLGYGETGFQGYAKDIPTPHLDGIAANGVRFTSGYVSGPYCSPTRAGLLTGRYQQRFGHEFNLGAPEDPSVKPGLPVEEKTIADRLKAAGYATGWFGKSHLGNTPEFHPLKRGFDEFYGFLGGAHGYLTPGAGVNVVQRGTEPVERVDYLTEAFGNEAVKFIESRKEGPWFVYLAFNAVHTPLEVTEKYEKRFTHIQDAKRRKFAALLSALDDAAGVVLAKVRELGQEENTIVVFHSDNGGPTAQTTSANGPLRGFKAQTWEGGVRVPFAIQWKGRLPAGKVEHRPVIQLDVLPTALAAAGADIPANIDGVNLLPYLTGEKTEEPHEALYWRFGRQLAVRKGDWKLVKAPNGGGVEGQTTGREPASADGARLYNLAADIGETTDLADKEPEQVKELTALWNAWNATLAAPKWHPSPKAAKRAERRGSSKTESASSSGGPWKSGDSVEAAEAPRVAGRAFRISAEIEPASPNGVIVAQGARGNGYALYLTEGKPALAVRSERRLSTVVSDASLPAGKRKIEALVEADGTVTLLVDGQKTAGGKLPGLIARQPAEGLTVGEDGGGAVGDYEAPHALKGEVREVTVGLP